jgi:serine/threonine protein kinase
MNSSKANLMVAQKYRIQKKVGSGAFGEIYKAVDVSNGDEVAIKFEPIKSKFP